ncbi:MAG TPA: hypothetical protein VIQ50_04750 [Xanthobacteraceae bacterium]
MVQGMMPKEEMSMYRFALVALLCVAALPSPSRAQNYPSKPIHSEYEKWRKVIVEGKIKPE